jgi:hypothetical protein
MKWLSIATCAGLLAGCVERRFVVTTDPAFATVFESGRGSIGASPADDNYVYYGKYHFTIIKDGFQTLQVDQNIPPPWYEYPGLDFITENLIPWTIRDVRQFHYSLEQMRVTNPKELLQEGELMRARGKAIQPPPPSSTQGTPVPPLPATVPVTAPNLGGAAPPSPAATTSKSTP